MCSITLSAAYPGVLTKIAIFHCSFNIPFAKIMTLELTYINRSQTQTTEFHSQNLPEEGMR